MCLNFSKNYNFEKSLTNDNQFKPFDEAEFALLLIFAIVGSAARVVVFRRTGHFDGAQTDRQVRLAALG